MKADLDAAFKDYLKTHPWSGTKLDPSTLDDTPFKASQAYTDAAMRITPQADQHLLDGWAMAGNEVPAGMSEEEFLADLKELDAFARGGAKVPLTKVNPALHPLHKQIAERNKLCGDLLNSLEKLNESEELDPYGQYQWSPKVYDALTDILNKYQTAGLYSDESEEYYDAIDVLKTAAEHLQKKQPQLASQVLGAHYGLELFAHNSTEASKALQNQAAALPELWKAPTFYARCRRDPQFQTMFPTYADYKAYWSALKQGKLPGLVTEEDFKKIFGVDPGSGQLIQPIQFRDDGTIQAYMKEELAKLYALGYASTPEDYEAYKQAMVGLFQECCDNICRPEDLQTDVDLAAYTDTKERLAADMLAIPYPRKSEESPGEDKEEAVPRSDDEKGAEEPGAGKEEEGGDAEHVKTPEEKAYEAFKNSPAHRYRAEMNAATRPFTQTLRMVEAGDLDPSELGEDSYKQILSKLYLPYIDPTSIGYNALMEYADVNKESKLTMDQIRPILLRNFLDQPACRDPNGIVSLCHAQAVNDGKRGMWTREEDGSITFCADVSDHMSDNEMLKRFRGAWRDFAPLFESKSGPDAAKSVQMGAAVALLNLYYSLEHRDDATPDLYLSPSEAEKVISYRTNPDLYPEGLEFYFTAATRNGAMPYSTPIYMDLNESYGALDDDLKATLRDIDQLGTDNIGGVVKSVHKQIVASNKGKIIERVAEQARSKGAAGEDAQDSSESIYAPYYSVGALNMLIDPQADKQLDEVIERCYGKGNIAAWWTKQKEYDPKELKTILKIAGKSGVRTALQEGKYSGDLKTHAEELVAYRDLAARTALSCNLLTRSVVEYNLGDRELGEVAWSIKDMDQAKKQKNPALVSEDDDGYNFIREYEYNEEMGRNIVRGDLTDQGVREFQAYLSEQVSPEYLFDQTVPEDQRPPIDPAKRLAYQWVSRMRTPRELAELLNESTPPTATKTDGYTQEDYNSAKNYLLGQFGEFYMNHFVPKYIGQMSPYHSAGFIGATINTEVKDKNGSINTYPVYRFKPISGSDAEYMLRFDKDDNGQQILNVYEIDGSGAPVKKVSSLKSFYKKSGEAAEGGPFERARRDKANAMAIGLLGKDVSWVNTVASTMALRTMTNLDVLGKYTSNDPATQSKLWLGHRVMDMTWKGAEGNEESYWNDEPSAIEDYMISYYDDLKDVFNAISSECTQRILEDHMKTGKYAIPKGYGNIELEWYTSKATDDSTPQYMGMVVRAGTKKGQKGGGKIIFSTDGMIAEGASEPSIDKDWIPMRLTYPLCGMINSRSFYEVAALIQKAGKDRRENNGSA